MRIKKTVWIVGAALAFVFLIGCGKRYGHRGNDSGGPAASASGGEVQEEDKIRLRFCWWGNEDRHIRTVAALKLYMEKHPNVEIQWDGVERLL